MSRMQGLSLQWEGSIGIPVYEAGIKAYLAVSLLSTVSTYGILSNILWRLPTTYYYWGSFVWTVLVIRYLHSAVAGEEKWECNGRYT
jgi:hypothetical protein